MKKLLQPKVLIPAILSFGLLASLVAVSDVKKLIHLMESFQHIFLLYFLAATIGYEVVRGVQWHYLLTAMGIRVPIRTQIFSFAVGEITKSLPIGNYFQNYVLQQAEGTDFGRSSAATTLIVLNEVAVSLLVVVILGLGSWNAWLRPLIIIGVLGVVAAVWLYRKLHHETGPPEWMKKREYLRKALDELKEFREGASDLLHARILLTQFAIGFIYVVIAGTGLYLIVRGINVGSISYWQALSVYCFSLAFGLIFPLPVDIGVTEISGVGAFAAVGLNRSAAVGAMLINRALSIGSAITIALIVMVVLHDELRAALKARGAQAKRSGDRAQSQASQPARGP